MREERAFAETGASERPGGAVAPVAIQGPSVRRIPILDGWRACSILLVLGSHLLPLGPKSLQLNPVAAAAGMALFFTLSGFLITSFLAAGMQVRDFLARRLSRIIPLGWAATIALILWQRPGFAVAMRNLLFIANLPPAALMHGGEHLWSLCVEMQFYVSIALVCLLFGRRGLYLIPVLTICVTGARIGAAERISIVTWHRIDEILAGGMLALTYSGWFGQRAIRMLEKLPVWPFGLSLLVCSHPAAGPLQYLRPYAASLLVGASLFGCPIGLRKALISRPMAYIAEVSYALYVIHGVLSATWLGTGDKLSKYLKRPLLIAATFLLAHISTRFLEQPITRTVRGMMRKHAKALASDAGPPSTSWRHAE